MPAKGFANGITCYGNPYYRACPSIQEYVLISTQRSSIEVYRRTTEKLWTLYPFERGEQVELASIGVTLPVAAIYENVKLPEDTTEI